MNIIAIDPGYDRCGVAILTQGSLNKHVLLYSGCITTSKEDIFEKRLHFIHEECEKLINTYSPESVALERLYFTNNQRTAMRVAEVRGMLLQLATAHNLPVSEYTPQQVKVAVAGSGRASKSDVQRMVPLLVQLEKNNRLDDEYDAIAIGLTHLASVRTQHALNN